MKDNHITTNNKQFNLLYRFADVFCLGLSLFIIRWIYLSDYSFNQNYLMLFGGFTALFLILAQAFGLYKTWKINLLKEQAIALIVPWTLSLLSFSLVMFLTKSSESFSRVVLGTWFIVAPITLFALRIVVNKVVTYLYLIGYNSKNAIIIGLNENSLLMANQIINNKQEPINIIGFYDDEEPSDELKAAIQSMDLTYNGRVEEGYQLAKNGDVDQVYVALPQRDESKINAVLSLFSDTTVNLLLMPSFVNYNMLRPQWRQMGNIQMLSVYDTPFYGFANGFKRLQDVVVSSIILLLISPILIGIAVGIKLTSKGPVIFKQKRNGLGGQKIEVWKFRSMTSMENGDVVKQATKNDARITPFGGFLRRTSLDELPQFFNVLQGRMSIVGPRPHAVSHNEEYRKLVERYMLRHKVKPGITGWAQINGFRGETDTLDKMENRIKYDLEYIQKWNFGMDIKIIFLTIFKGFVSKTAY
ncbi:undecaprenyl-phosphate glucose phosphotransferase [Vibrio sp. SS-MA-C1-2]|uniref:undecaprenyl-phosphate glucose phosphotransferase n=1 Tax=Vibrio sp. SS-MA-C1-2 TaxID=2908646 RepID=UPI001F3F9355|nr:undecaprenyl-phosphate glucose phosphotransferase [Vibrio sp. SS-MA-C1-2]UJF17123.1 undecaprenyl-phosphate glucose phosphotransferase [Vibrio sp. SS-MA-C1-2]